MRRNAEACSALAWSVSAAGPRAPSVTRAGAGLRGVEIGSHGGPFGKSSPNRSGCAAPLTTDAVTVTDQAADFEVGKAIQIRADHGDLALDFWVQGRGIFRRLDHVR